MSTNPEPEIETRAVVLRGEGPVTRAADNPMTVADIVGQVKLIQEVMGKVMQEGEHYGQIPGCGNRKTLLQPGAQKLTMTFRLAPEYQIQETNFDKGHKEYRVICTLKSIASGSFVGQGVGCCSTLESKYRWRAGARKCPECGKETIIKGKAEYGGGWLCFAKKGGCGAKWTDDSDAGEEFADANIDKVEHDSPADFYNTVLKMAKKRAFVDATITATAASDIFTQDIGDEEGDSEPEQPPKMPQDAPGPRQAQSQAQPKKAPASPQSATAEPTGRKGEEKQWDSFLEACKARLLQLIKPDEEWAWWRYAVDRDWILTSESLLEARADKIFDGLDRKNAKDSVATIFAEHTNAVLAMVANTPPDMKEEILRGFVQMLDAKRAQKPAAKQSKAPGKVCFACNSTAIKKHDELIGVTWCEQCGTQWQDGDANKEPYEEHEWMFAKLPFAPKDPQKKAYSGLSLGQLSRIDSKYFYGIVMNFEAKPFNGRLPSQESVEFGEACLLARKHIETGKEEQPESGDDGSDVPS